MQDKTGRKLTIARAMNEAIAQEMRTDESIFIMGEDIRSVGGIWGHTAGLVEEFGEDRVRDTPISETGFIGAAVGAAAVGMRPIVELMFVDFFGVCMDAIYNLAAKNFYFSGGQTPIPMVINTAVGGGYSDAGQHSQVLYATFSHLPGLKVIVPSNAYDAKGLMTAAIRENNPVMFMFHKNLQGMGFLGTIQRSINGVPEESYTIPIGSAKVVREGQDITVAGLGVTVHMALDAAELLAEKGVSVEVIDLRSLVPLDRDTIFDSVLKTGNLIIVDDDYRSYGITAEIIASITERDISVFKSSPQRIAYPDIPVPFARPMEQFALPSAEKIINVANKILRID